MSAIYKNGKYYLSNSLVPADEITILNHQYKEIHYGRNL